MKLLAILLFLFVALLPAPTSRAQQKVDWNGYLQYRFTDNYLDQAFFSVRRAKLWLNGTLPEDAHTWNYKLQAMFHQQAQFDFLLQDVYVSYRTNGLEFTAGQFVPDFSLQRKQPDYIIPLVERAAVVSALVPAAETMARDIGVEVKLSENHLGSISLGFLNGNGANTLSNKRNFLLVQRGTLSLLDADATFQLGYNLSYRHATTIQFTKILGPNVSFSGNDFRFGFEGRFALWGIEVQSEYIEAHLGDQRAHGFYALADYLITPEHRITLSIEKLRDLNPSTQDDPWYIVAYSYLLKGDEIKLSVDNRFQFTGSNTNSLTTLQIQYFFHQS
jgi:phosphate-selective porin